MVSPFVPSVTLEVGLTWLSLVDIEDSRVSIVLLQLACDMVVGPKLVSNTLVVSPCTGVLRDMEFAAEEGGVPETVEDLEDGEVTKKEGVCVPSRREGSVHVTPSGSLLKRVDISEDETRCVPSESVPVEGPVVGVLDLSVLCCVE